MRDVLSNQIKTAIKYFDRRRKAVDANLAEQELVDIIAFICDFAMENDITSADMEQMILEADTNRRPFMEDLVHRILH